MPDSIKPGQLNDIFMRHRAVGGESSSDEEGQEGNPEDDDGMYKCYE